MTDAQLGGFDRYSDRVRRQLRTFPLKFRELSEGGELRRVLDATGTKTLRGPIVGQQPEVFTEQYLIEPVLHALGYTDPASPEYDGTGGHFVRRPTTFRTVEKKRPDYLLKRVDPSLVCILEAKAANREQKSERAATTDIREYIEVNTFCKYLRELDHEYLIAIGTDGLRWTLWRSRLQDDSEGRVCRVDLSPEIKAIAKRLDVIEGESDRTPDEIRGALTRFVDHFAVDRLPSKIKE
ncbi:hypothetical protein DU504_00440 [Haloplanus salinus]|uniref:Type I restriction enzyme R protein N-terminal domain-containing protein n=1 Tax=Haloplanus salinus TaxID=1126245 RepID=A0A368N8K3_9EURY|nr:hypothetical protein [Haloplanus salinus]RCU45905.1 hypothetical protein DU504_00440 [Haloplanus salinus]